MVRGAFGARRTITSSMDCVGCVLVEITGIPLELLGLLTGLDSDGDPGRVAGVDEAGMVDGGGDMPAATRWAMRETKPIENEEEEEEEEEGRSPSIELMRRLVIGRPRVDYTGQNLSTGAEDQQHSTGGLESVTRRRTLRYERRLQSVTWNQHCCGANAARTRAKPMAVPSIINSRRRGHQFDLEPDVIKIR